MDFDILLSIVSHRGMTPPTAYSIEKLRMVQNRLGFLYSVSIFSGDALLSRARSMAASRFLEETKAKYLLFIDDDIAFEPDHIVKIYQDLETGKYHLIGGIYPVSGATQLSSYGWGGQFQADGTIKDIEFLATGFMGISRKLLIKIRDELKLPLLNPNDWSRCWPFFECGRFEKREKGGDPIYISEDWDFSYKARLVGETVWADTSVQVEHLREKLFSVRDVSINQSKAVMDAQVYGAMTHQANLMGKIEDDLSEFFHMAPGRVKEVMVNAQERLAKEWSERKGSVEAFYLDNVTSLFDLAIFNQQQYYYDQRLSPLLGRSGLKVLDIGCGIGTAVFMLSEQGNDATGWDINKKAIAFCEFRKAKHKLKGEFTTEKSDFARFDLIVAIDMLEHIEDLKGFLAELGKGMKSGAKLYHSDYFPKGEKGTWPMHFEEHQQHLDEWLNAASLKPWDERWAIKV